MDGRTDGQAQMSYQYAPSTSPKLRGIKNIHCDPSSELTYQYGSNEGLQHMFFVEKQENFF